MADMASLTTVGELDFDIDDLDLDIIEISAVNDAVQLPETGASSGTSSCGSTSCCGSCSCCCA